MQQPWHPHLRNKSPPLAGLLAGLLAALGWAAVGTAWPAGLGGELRSLGCGKPAMTGLSGRAAPDGDLRRRTFRVLAPADYSPSRAYPLVFVFHGAGGSAADSLGWGLQNAPGAAHEAIFVFPDGIDFNHEGAGWDDRSEGYDLPFFDHMVDDLESAYCIDRQAVFATGFSWGADFSLALDCQRGDVLGAIVINSASDEFSDPKDAATYEDLPCHSHRHPPLLYAHAKDGDAIYKAPLFATTATLLRSFNGCTADSRRAATASTVMSCVAFQGCAAELVECPFAAAIGHTLPPHWAEDTWRFLQAHAH